MHLMFPAAGLGALFSVPDYEAGATVGGRMDSVNNGTMQTWVVRSAL